MKTKFLLSAIAIGALLSGPLAFSAEEKEEPIKPIKEIFEPKGSFPADKFIKVAVIQWAPPVTELVKTKAEAQKTMDRNRALLAEQIQTAAGNGAKIIITSEMGVVGYPDIPELPSDEDNFQTREQVAPWTESVPGPSTKYFGTLAKSLGVYIQFGFIEESASKFYNVAVAVDPNGNIIGKHRKVSLYHLEENYYTPGKTVNTYETPAGTIGMMICADVYHYGVLSQYTGKTDALALSTSWAQQNTGWTSFTAAARQTGAIMMAANQPYFPDSGVVQPNGKVQSHIRQTTEGIAYGYLPLKAAKTK